MTEYDANRGALIPIIFDEFVGIPIGLAFDLPYYTPIGVYYGLYYGGMGLGYGFYYGGLWVYDAAAYVGRGILQGFQVVGGALASPFKRRSHPRQPTAWQQLACSAAISQSALAVTRRIPTEPAGNVDADLQQAKYLSDQAADALSGQSTDASCFASPPRRMRFRPRLELLRYQALWRLVGAKAEELADARKQTVVLKQEITAASRRGARLRAEIRLLQRQEAENKASANEIKKKIRKKKDDLAEALAARKAAQVALERVEGHTVAAQGALEKLGQLSGSITRGQEPEDVEELYSQLTQEPAQEAPAAVSPGELLPRPSGGAFSARRQDGLAPSPAPRNARAFRAGIEWVSIPGGTFTMGSLDYSDAGPYRVTMQAFQMAKSLVTNKQYQKCVEAAACTAAHYSDGSCWIYNASQWERGIVPGRLRGSDQPVVCVDWSQAEAFSRWVGGRLPSEAEWEYAARSAGKDWKYPWGDAPVTCARAVIAEGGDGCGHGSTWPVCSKPRGNTRQGLCDMSGNVEEWVQDWYHDSYMGESAYGGAWAGSGAFRVIRGGSWNDDSSHTRSSYRGFMVPASQNFHLGFRPARS